MKNYIKKYFWIILAITLILLRWLGGMFPASIEYVYSRGFFLGIRAVFDYTIGWLPIPMFYVFFILLIAFLVKYIRRSFQIKKPFKERGIKFGFHILQFVSIIIVWFLLIWGYNYGRIPIEDQLELTLKPLSIEEIKEETKRTTREAIEFRKSVEEVDTNALGEEFLPKDLENEMRANLKSVLAELGYPTFGRVRARQLYPGTLLRLRTAGIYWFFVGEGNIDNGLHPLQKPFTTAHEMAHGYGFGDEGTCNFLAYLACLKSKNTYVQYAGNFAYWRYMAREYKKRQPEEYQQFRDLNLSKGMENDLKAIYENGQKYPSILNGVRDATYDTYLKAQGLDDGLENYNRVVVLVNGWKRKN